MKARSAISLAGHAADAVVWFDDPSGSWATSKAFASGPVPEVKEFVDRYPYEKDLGRVWTLSAPPESYVMRDAGHRRTAAGWLEWSVSSSDQRPRRHRRAVLRPVAGHAAGRRVPGTHGGIARGQLQAGTAPGHGLPRRELFRARRRRSCLRPESREIEDILRQLDVTLGALIAHLDEKVGRSNYALALSADHGVAPNPVAPRGGRIATEDVRERIEDALTTAWGPIAKGSYVDAVNFTDVYLAEGVFDKLRANAQLMASIVMDDREIPGVARVLRTDQLSRPAAIPWCERRAQLLQQSKR
jgi:hypothetical protein